MAGGAPRTVSLSPDEMIKLGEEMLEWVKLNKDTILHLSEWYTIEKGYIYNQWKAFIQIKEFLPYYERCLKIVGKKYLEKDNNVRDRISDRWQRIYFKDLKEQEDQDADDEVERKLKSQSTIPPNDDKIDKENEEMRENSILRKENAELRAKLENKS